MSNIICHHTFESQAQNNIRHQFPNWTDPIFTVVKCTGVIECGGRVVSALLYAHFKGLRGLLYLGLFFQQDDADYYEYYVKYKYEAENKEGHGNEDDDTVGG